MNILTKRILKTGAIAAIIVLLVGFIFERLLVSRLLLLSPMMSRQSPHLIGTSNTVLFLGILGAGLLLLLVVGLLLSKQSRRNGGVSDSEPPYLTDDVCPGCGADVLSNQKQCPYCGYELA